MIKKLLAALGLALGIASTAYAVTPFNSAQVATTSLSNGSILQTDGTWSRWIATSSLGFPIGITNAYASSTFASFIYGSSTYVNYGYGSSTFINYPYASTTFSSFGYGSSTYYFASNPSGYITSAALAPYVTFVYASSTFPSFSYASSTFASTSWITSTFPTFLYGSSTYVTYPYASSTFHTFAYASSTFPSFIYGSSTYVTYPYASSTFAGLFTNNTFSGLNTFNATTTIATTTISSSTISNLNIPVSLFFNNATGSSLFATNGRFTNSSSTNSTTTNFNLSGWFRDSVNATGTAGQYLQSTGTSTLWTTISQGITNAYASSTFVNFIYASSTFPSFTYGTSTYVTYPYASTTFNNFAYSSSTFPTFAYASSTFASTSWIVATFPTFSYASSTFPNFTYGSSTYLSLLYASSSYVNYPYASSTFPSFAYASSTFATGTNLWGGTLAGNIFNLNNGSIGIGTTTPRAQVHMNSASTTNTTLAVQATTSQTGTLFDVWSSTGSSLMNVQPSGLIGIGTSTPLDKLSIIGSEYLSGAFKDSTSATGTLNQVLVSTGTSTLWVATSSLFGIIGGLYTGVAPIRVTGTLISTDFSTTSVNSYSQQQTFINASSTSGFTSPSLYFTNATGTNVFATLFPTGITNSILSTDASGKIVATTTSQFATGTNFWTGSLNGSISNLNSSNIALGTTTPFAKLAVQGQINSGLNVFEVASSTSTTGATSSLFSVLANGRIGIGTSTPITSMQFYSNNTSGLDPSIAIGGNMGGDTDFTFGRANNNDAADNDSFQIVKGITTSTSTSLFTLDWLGRLGLGTTTPSRTLSIVGDERLTGAFGDSINATGTLNQVLVSTGTSTLWVSTSSIFGSGGIIYTCTYPILCPSNVISSGLSTSSPFVIWSGTTTLATTTVNGSSTLIGQVYMGLASSTALTASSLYFTNATGTSLFVTNASSTNATSSLFFAINSILNNATSTNFFTTTGSSSLFRITNASTTSLTLVGSLYDSTNALGTLGQVLQATGTSTQWITSTGITGGGAKGKLAVYSSGTNIVSGITYDNGVVTGINATTSTSTFNIQGTGILDIFHVASSSGASFFSVKSSGNVGIGTSTPFFALTVATGSPVVVQYDWGTATSSTMVYDVAQRNNQHMQLGTGAVTISFRNATSTAGATWSLDVDAPAGGTEGTITWINVQWCGQTVPTQTTAANSSDTYSFRSTKATSSVIIKGCYSLKF